MKITIKHLTRKTDMKIRRNLTPDRFFNVKTDVINVEIPHSQRDSNVLLENINAETVTSLVILVACTTKNKSHTRRDQDHQRHINWPVVDYLHKRIQCKEIQLIAHQVNMNLSAYKWGYKLYKLMTSTQHQSICLQIWHSKSSYTRTKPSSCEPELIPAQV